MKHTLDSDLIATNTADRQTNIPAIGAFYLPPAHADAWGVDTVVWRLDRDEPGRLPPALGSLVVIVGVPESSNPNGRTWVTGLVRSWTLTLPDDVVELQLATVRGVTTPEVADNRLTWAEVPAGTPTWAQLRPDHTWDDYDLLGGS